MYTITLSISLYTGDTRPGNHMRKSSGIRLSVSKEDHLGAKSRNYLSPMSVPGRMPSYDGFLFGRDCWRLRFGRHGIASLSNRPKKEEGTKGSLIIPDTANEKRQEDKSLLSIRENSRTPRGNHLLCAIARRYSTPAL